MRNAFKKFDFGKPRHKIWVTEENQNKQRPKGSRVASSNRRRAAERKILEKLA